MVILIQTNLSDPLRVPIKPERVTIIEVVSVSPLILAGSEFFRSEMDVAVYEGIGGKMMATWSRSVCGVIGRNEEGVVGRRITA